MIKLNIMSTEKNGHYQMLFSDKNEFIKTNPNPIEYLEGAVISCIGKCILEYINEKKLKNNPFKNIRVSFSNKSIKISCDVYQEYDSYINVFKYIVHNCYILSNLSIDKDITVKVI